MVGALGTVLLTSCGENVAPEKVGEAGKPASVQSPAEAPKSYKVGDKVKLYEQILTVLNAGEYVSKNAYLKPKDGMKYYAVEVEVENVGQKPNAYNPMYFKLVDANSYSYNMSYMGGKEPALQSGDLQPTKKTRGFITFEVPLDAAGLELVFAPNLLDSSEARIKL